MCILKVITLVPCHKQPSSTKLQHTGRKSELNCLTHSLEAVTVHAKKAPYSPLRNLILQSLLKQTTVTHADLLPRDHLSEWKFQNSVNRRKTPTPPQAKDTEVALKTEAAQEE